MSLSILSVMIRNEHDTVDARQRARQIARLLGFEARDQTRISTAVSEIARNVFNYGGGGKAEFVVEGISAPQLFIIKISDQGPGIPNLDVILEGRYESRTGMGMGIIGARRLMDQFQIESKPNKGTTVWLKKLFSKRAPVIGETELVRIADALARERPQDPYRELQYQNHELMRALEELRSRQTELTRVNRELEDTNRGVVALYAELDEKADHLRRADELKTKFLSNMSHEFRSPLNSILALSGLLINRSDGDLTSEQHHQVGYIRKAAQDLLELVNDLLDLAKVEAGKVEAKPIDFEVANLFAALRGMLKPLLVNQSVDLVFEDAEDIPSMYSDEGKISQILRNFISNALKFTEKGEVRITASLVGDNEVEFRVADTGIGIAPEHLNLIFQDFVQLDNPIQRRFKGTGLGLPLSKKLAAFLGGHVNVHSTLGVGSTFSVRVPLRYHDPSDEQIAIATEWVPEPGSAPVLFIEDSPEMVMAYKSYLKGSGFQLISAATTRDAENILDQVQPRAIVLDIALRSEDTWALMAKLKEDARTKHIGILVASSIEDRAKGFHLGADAYITKPFERATLLDQLRALTGVSVARRVLIIDDNEVDRYLLKQRLANLPAAISITEASSGLQGLDMALQCRPDLIFLDVAMPGMTGFEVLEKLKNTSELINIPVVIVTSHILSDIERELLMKDAVSIISKDDLSAAAINAAFDRSLRETEAPETTTDQLRLFWQGR